MASYPVTHDQMASFIKNAVEEAINREVEATIEEYKSKIEEKVRAKTAAIALNVLAHYDIMRHQDHVVITVKHDGR